MVVVPENNVKFIINRSNDDDWKCKAKITLQNLIPWEI